MNELVINDRVYRTAIWLNINYNSFNRTDISCTLMSGMWDLISKVSAIFLSLSSLKSEDRILKSFEVTGLCPVLMVCCSRWNFSPRLSFGLKVRVHLKDWLYVLIFSLRKWWHQYPGSLHRQEAKIRIKVKGSIDFAQTHNVAYEAVCPNNIYKKRYIGKTGKRPSLRPKENLGEKFHLEQHTIRTGHRPVTSNDFKILSSGFRLPRNRKIAEAWLIGSHKPDNVVQAVLIYI